MLIGSAVTASTESFGLKLYRCSYEIDTSHLQEIAKKNVTVNLTSPLQEITRHCRVSCGYATSYVQGYTSHFTCHMLAYNSTVVLPRPKRTVEH